jgi:XTP/dITP diphosphohydrolase
VPVGRTFVLCTVCEEAGVPRFLAGSGRGWLTAEYSMLPGSTDTRAEREGRARSAVGPHARDPAPDRSQPARGDRLEALGERTLWVDCDVLQADGGTRCASITGASVALSIAAGRLAARGAVARNPLRDSVAAVSVGIVKGELLLDLPYAEDSIAEIDMNVVATGAGAWWKCRALASTARSRAMSSRSSRTSRCAAPQSSRASRRERYSRRPVDRCPRARGRDRQRGKLREIRELLADARVSLRSLAEFPGLALPEEGDDYEKNADRQGACGGGGDRTRGDRRRLGIEVDRARGTTRAALGALWRSGLDDAGRVALLLRELAACAPGARGARFVCVAALATPMAQSSTGARRVRGEIAETPRGSGGFGYDPVFMPSGEGAAMAELPEARKNQISHRAVAFRALRGAIDRALATAPTQFVLIRHAESVWNADERWQGQADPPLSARGVAQAEAVARALAQQRADRLLCSDLQRARQTAEIVGRTLGLVPSTDPRLRELDVGRWAGLTRGEIEALDPEPLRRFEAEDAEVRAGGGESRAEIRARVRRAFRELARTYAGERLIVVTHLGVVRALRPAQNSRTRRAS